MTLHVHPAVLWASESTHATEATIQHQYKVGGLNIEYARFLEGKPALLLITDADSNILLSIVGSTGWEHNDMASLDESFDLGPLAIRHKVGAASTSTIHSLGTNKERLWTPYYPALRFTPATSFNEVIRRNGTAKKAYLIADTREQFSTTEISAWPSELWNGTQALDLNTLPTNVTYLEMSVGDVTSSATVRLTNTVLNVNDGSVQTADPYLDIYFTNAFDDWSNAKAEMKAIIDGLPWIGKDIDEIVAKETLHYNLPTE
ncbi:hypothetical protein [Pseudoalteromonas umbrosa]|uniref:hypothetical protein n=1 Tax=Pseudoalteromonas umbrosa TaxID=3048489 RepID=UPI0024C2A92C|nr:hypothetical protein [Pseudoalteromonas sp. B95]MDK1290074.1 hypothetical protein [Pseudoalteromonas sp. B95]